LEDLVGFCEFIQEDELLFEALIEPKSKKFSE
jgi:hypothetical protein